MGGLQLLHVSIRPYQMGLRTKRIGAIRSLAEPPPGPCLPLLFFFLIWMDGDVCLGYVESSRFINKTV